MNIFHWNVVRNELLSCFKWLEDQDNMISKYSFLAMKNCALEVSLSIQNSSNPPISFSQYKKQLFITHVSHLSYTTIGTLLTWEGPSSKFLIQYHSKPFQYFHFTKLPKESSSSRSIPSYNKTVSYLKILTFYLKGWLFFDFCRVLLFETVITFRL